MTAWVILTLLAAMVYGNLLEWLMHRFVLHELGKRKIAFREHWYRHHRNARKNSFADDDYRGWSWSWEGRWSEVFGLSVLALLHLPLAFVAPLFYGGLVAWTLLYYFVHSFSHRHPRLGKKLFPWHYDHHLGQNQNANWCVVMPLWDYILGTRIKYH